MLEIKLEDLFLDEKVQIKVSQVRTEHKELFDLIKKFNHLFVRIVESFINQKVPNRINYIYTMFSQMHYSYQAYILLLERGLYDDSQIILRSLCDKAIKILYVLNKKENYYLLGQDIINKKIKKLSNLDGTEMIKIIGEDRINKEIEELKKYQKDPKVSLPTIKQICDQIDMKDLYIQYSILSDYTHENLNVLMENNVVLDEGIIIGKGFRYEDFYNDVSMSISFFEIVLSKMNSLLDLEEYVVDFEKIKRKLDLLCKKKEDKRFANNWILYFWYIRYNKTKRN